MKEKTFWKSVALTASLFLGFAGPVFGQLPERFAGIESIYIWVVELGREETDCNLTESGLRSAVAPTIDRSRLRIVNEAVTVAAIEGRQSDLWIAVSGYRLQSGTCVAHVTLQARRAGRIVLGNRTLPDFVSVEVFRAGVLLTGPTSTFRARVHDALREFTEEMLTAWIRDNPR